MLRRSRKQAKGTPCDEFEGSGSWKELKFVLLAVCRTMYFVRNIGIRLLCLQDLQAHEANRVCVVVYRTCDADWDVPKLVNSVIAEGYADKAMMERQF